MKCRLLNLLLDYPMNCDCRQRQALTAASGAAPGVAAALNEIKLHHENELYVYKQANKQRSGSGR